MSAPKNPREIVISEYTYDLPENNIASVPLADRDAAKLLIYQNGQISERRYHQLAEAIPPGYLLVFNNTRVVEARLFFTKSTGARIEIFCLEPPAEYPDITTAMAQCGTVRWTCLVGGAAKWKKDEVLRKQIATENGDMLLEARMAARNPDSFTIEFSWSPARLSFAELLHFMGVIPIPPYLKRATTAADAERYQTIYAQQEGSVAAPTAGLHFTDKVFSSLAAKGIRKSFVTLHVGAGTFKPVKSEKIGDHEMHAEFMDVELDTLRQLIDASGKVIAVGTTSLRTLESLYWMGVKAYLQPQRSIDQLPVQQWEVMDEWLHAAVPVEAALKALLQQVEKAGLNRILCKTQIMMMPGYPVKMVEALITNFHQPQSTLLLLVAALIGEDWRKVYNYALGHEFRFLSYGDGSLLWRNT